MQTSLSGTFHLKISRQSAFAAALAIFFSTAVCFPLPVSAASFTNAAAGTTGADFLNLGAGARAMGMGGAYSAIAEEASGIYWNPAGLVQIPRLSATFMRASYVADINYQYAAYAHRLSNSSVLAASMLTTEIGTIKQTDVSNNSMGTFSPRDQVYTLSYSKAILELSDRERDVSMGVSAKYMNSKIVDSASGYGFDLGVMSYNFGAIPYRLSVVMQNLGQGLKYDSEKAPLPTTFKLGGSLFPLNNLLLAADLVLPKGNSPLMLLGTELSTEPTDRTRISIRGGMNSRMMSDGLGGLSVGTGISLHFFTVDYAFVPMGELGNTHRISITFDFPYRSPVFQRRDRSVFTQLKDYSLPEK